ncbi:MAG: hypothetical protein N2512_02375 [Armatimonadetes bacterium]|nr:hypothetical protein [Armatimonadota bacterium]
MACPPKNLWSGSVLRTGAVASGGPSTGRHDLVVAAVLCLASWVLLALTAADIGITYDEPIYMSRAHLAWDWLTLLVSDPRAALSPQAIDFFWHGKDQHPGLVKLTAAITSRVSVHLLPAWAVPLTYLRTGTMFWVGLALGGMYVVLRAAGLGRAVAIFAPAALFFMPHVFGAAHLLALDAPAMATCFLAVAAGWWATERSGRGELMLAGLAFGIALATKLNGFFVPLVVLPYAFALRWKRAVLLSASYVLLGPVVFWLTWPWLWHKTFERLTSYLAFHWHHWEIGVLYFGKVYTLAPWHYPLVMTAITTPPVTLLLAVGGFGGSVLAFRRLTGAWGKSCNVGVGIPGCGSCAPLRGTSADRLWVLAAWALVVNLVPNMLPSTPKYGGVRLFLPAMAWLAVLAGFALRFLLDRAHRHLRPPARQSWVVSAVLLAAALLPSVSYVAHFYPYELSAYNAFIGGLPGAARKGFEPTYWGETYLQAARWLSQHAPTGAVVWIEPPGVESVVRMYKYLGELRPDLRTCAGPAAFATADYAVSQNKPTEFTDTVKKLVAESTPVWTESIDGVPLVYVWKLR